MLLFLGCQTTTTQNANNLDRPERIAVVCTTGSNCSAPLADVVPCDSDAPRARRCGFITNGARGDLAVADMSGGVVVDTNPEIPGFTRLPLNGQASDILFLEESAMLLIPVERSGEALLTLRDAVNYEEVFAEIVLDEAPSSLIHKGNSVWLTLPQSRTVQEYTMENSETPMKLVREFNTGFAPFSIAYIEESDLLLVGFRDAAHVTAFERVGGAPSWSVPTGPACLDRLDNDKNCLTEAEDPACRRGNLWGETTAYTESTCSNGLDDDGDGLTDAEEDPGCDNAADWSEFSDGTSCSDGLDGDGDGLVDGEDPDCSSGPFQREGVGCSDGADNNGDGLLDSEDPLCSGTFTLSETPAALHCEDGLDNDGDGQVDQEDPDCVDGRGFGEVSPLCSNGLDDDGDGQVDYEDPDCLSRSGGSESSPLRNVFGHIALSPDQKFAYVLNRELAQVFVVDVVQGSLVDINNRAPGLGQPLLAQENIRGIPLPTLRSKSSFTPQRCKWTELM